MVDERQYRRPGAFDQANGEWINLNGGSPFCFPRVWVALKPTFKGGKLESSRLYSSRGDEFDGLVTALDQAANDLDYVQATIMLAAHMLSIHYDLPDDVLGTLLEAPMGSAMSDLNHWVFQVGRVARGQSLPKEPSIPGDSSL
jgi:hypothetical protein